MYVKQAIDVKTGEIFSHDESDILSKVELLVKLAETGFLICFECKGPVEIAVNPYTDAPLLFFCHSCHPECGCTNCFKPKKNNKED